jgi:hypothetical protein
MIGVFVGGRWRKVAVTVLPTLGGADASGKQSST